MDKPNRKVRVLVVGASNTGKTTIAHVIKVALEEAGFQHVTLQDLPETDNKPPINQRIGITKARHVSIEVVPENRVMLGDASIIVKGPAQ